MSELLTTPPSKPRYQGMEELGKKWEYRVCDLLSQHGYPRQVPTREVNPELDAKKVDITSAKGAWTHTPYHIQCKSSAGGLSNHHQLLFQMQDKAPKGKPCVIFHQQTREVKGEFVEVGQYAILKLEDFLSLTQHNPY